MERVVTIKQGEYRDDNLRIYVDEDGATITFFDRDSLKIEEEIHEVMQEEIENFIPNSYENYKTLEGGFKTKSINGDCKSREFNPDFYTKPCKPRGGRPSAIPLSEIKERILAYGKEKDPGGQGFTFRYGAGNSAPVESRNESHEITKRVSGDKRRVKIALLGLIDEEKITRKPHSKRQNTFIYFLNGKQKTETSEQTKEELLKN